MRIQLSDHFDYKRMLRFTFPSIIMMMFTSIYGVVDGFFVSNFVGKTSFAALNLIMPYIMILGNFGFMFSSGGSALVAKTLGADGNKEANSIFSLIVYVSTIFGVLLSAICFVTIRPVAKFLGAEGQLLEDAVIYGGIMAIGIISFMLQFEFQSFFITAEKPKLGLYVTVLSGITNIVLDALFMAVFKWGIAGAAFATVLSQVVASVIPIIYFSKKNDSLLRLTKARFDGRALLKTCTNGSSEFVANVSSSLVGMLYNIQLIEYAGENGIAAYGVIMYVTFVFTAMYIGFSNGIAPVVGYHYGAKNHIELKNLLKRSLIIIGVIVVSMVSIAEILAYPISYAFVGYDKELLKLTVSAFLIYSLSYLFSGFTFFSSSFFTALNDGLTSAIIAFARTLVFQFGAIIVFPLIWGINGIWISIVSAEFMALVLNAFFLVAKRKKYQY